MWEWVGDTLATGAASIPTLFITQATFTITPGTSTFRRGARTTTQGTITTRATFTFTATRGTAPGVNL